MIHQTEQTGAGEGRLEVRDQRISERTRWSIRAAQWQALRFAREIFGESAAVRLGSFPARGAFQGLVHVRVPFAGMDDHRRRERLFVRLAGADELLTHVPLVFVFEPDPSASPAGGTLPHGEAPLTEGSPPSREAV